MSVLFPPELIVGASAFLGAMVGSFLNVCIYRLPREQSVCRPARSFCPGCRKTIPWWENIPLVSWVCLRGRCSSCRVSISPRYFLVELLTALLFAGVAACADPAHLWIMVPQWVFVAILLVATFVDLEHLIIPDEITWGGVVAGLAFSFGLPELQGATGRVEGFAASLLGAVVGYGLLWGVVEGGRLLFGRKKNCYAPPVEVVWTRSGEEAVLLVGEEEMAWGEFFFRGTERLHMKVLRSELDGLALGKGEFQWGLNEVRTEGRVFDLNKVHQIRLEAEWIVFPREAMGFGDVKFLAAIGAFLGWKAVLFTVVAASSLGAIVGMLLLIFRKHRSVIPFGPYLALGAFLWMAAGPVLVDAYWRWVGFAMAR